MSRSSETHAVCPLCGKTAEPGFAPFCSRRCADIDLGRWLKGTYTIPGEAAESTSPVPDTGETADDG